MFGPYLVYEKLGVGGMASVHRAAKRGIAGFERRCALKRLLPHLAEDGDFVRSFVREAKLASHLQHSSIAQIYELGRVGPAYFMAMEYIDGFDLRKILKQARREGKHPPANVVVALLIELCDALDYAHTRTDDVSGEALGLVHRDVSPSNLIVSRDGHLKVIDFGIAKATANKLRTETGRVKGKLGYMSPEAVKGGPLDARSDVFSAGIVAHELLCVRPLFASKTDFETLSKIHNHEVLPPSVHNPGCPVELDDVVLQALAKAPEERWECAADMRDALHAVALTRGLTATSAQIVEWLDWLFGDEPTQIFDAPLAEPEPLDELTAIAWGAPTVENDGPVLVPDVPDVSDQIPWLEVEDDATVVDEPRPLAPPLPPPPLPRPEIRMGGSASGVVDVPPPPPPRITFRPDPTPRRHAPPPPPSPTPTPSRIAVGTTPPPVEYPRERTRPAAAGPAPARDGLSRRRWLAIGTAVGSLAAASVTAFVLARGDDAPLRSAALAPPPPPVADAAPPGPDAAPADAHLAVATTPAHLAVAIDDLYLERATPVELTVRPGPHSITISDQGRELWRTTFTAEPGTRYSFHPILDSE